MHTYGNQQSQMLMWLEITESHWLSIEINGGLLLCDTGTVVWMAVKSQVSSGSRICEAELSVQSCLRFPGVSTSTFSNSIMMTCLWGSLAWQKSNTYLSYSWSSSHCLTWQGTTTLLYSLTTNFAAMRKAWMILSGNLKCDIFQPSIAPFSFL